MMPMPMPMPMAAIAAALILTLPAAAQEKPQRFRYLGQADQFAVMVTEASGPQSARMLTLIVAAGQEAGPGGSDSFVISLRSDCPGNIIQMMSAQAWAGTEKLQVASDPAPAHPPEAGTPYKPAFDYACTGKVPDGPAVWIDGADAARAYALKRARDASQGNDR